MSTVGCPALCQEAGCVSIVGKDLPNPSVHGMQPFEFTAGATVSNAGKKINDSANGLFAGGGGPKAPPALSNAVIGMKLGGKV